MIKESKILGNSVGKIICCREFGIFEIFLSVWLWYSSWGGKFFWMFGGRKWGEENLLFFLYVIEIIGWFYFKVYFDVVLRMIKKGIYGWSFLNERLWCFRVNNVNWDGDVDRCKFFLWMKLFRFLMGLIREGKVMIWILNEIIV